MEIDHSGHRQRLKNALRSGGMLSFAPHEAAEMMLYAALPRRDVNALAHTLTEKAGSVGALIEAEESEIVRMGASEGTARILSAFGACVRVCREGVTGGFVRTRGELEVLLDRLSSAKNGAAAISRAGEILGEFTLPGKNAASAAARELISLGASSLIFVAEEDYPEKEMENLKIFLKNTDMELKIFTKNGGERKERV